MPLQIAENPQGDRVVLVDNEWVPITQTAVNAAGAEAYLAGNKWLTNEPIAPTPTLPVTKPKPAPVVEEVPSSGNPMGDFGGEAPAERTLPLLERKPATPSPALPTTSFAPVTPEMRKVAQAAWSTATPEQRVAMQNQPGWRGQIARDIAGQIEGIDLNAPTSTMAKFDPRVEARKRQLILQGEDPRFAETAAREAALAGVAPGKEIEFLEHTQGLATPTKSLVDTTDIVPGEKPADFGGIATNAVMRGIYQNVAIMDALGAAGAKAVGADDVALALAKLYLTNAATAKKYTAGVGSFTDIKSWDDIPTYALEGILENLPQLAAGLGAGTLGGLIARKTGTRAIEGMVGEQAANALIKRQAIGAGIGASTVAVGSETGSIYGDIVKETGQERPGVALAFGLVAGALDAVPAMRAAITLLTPKAVNWTVKEIAKRYGKEAGIQLASESGTEFLQTWVEKAATSYVDGRPLLTKENLIEAVDAFLKGGISGTALGVSSKAASDIANRQANRALGVTEKAETAAEAAKTKALSSWAAINATPAPTAPYTPVTPTAAPVAPPTPSAQGVIAPDQATRLAELTQQYIAAGIEETNAGLMALAVVRKEAETAAEQAAPPAVAPAPPAPPAAPLTPVQTRAAEIEDELINAGVPPAQAKIDALAKAQQEEADDAAAAKAEEEPPAPAPPAPTPAPPAPTPAPPAPTPAPPAPTPAPPAPTPAPTPAPAPAPVAAPVTVTATRLTKDAEGKSVTRLTLSNGASETLFSIDGKWHGKAAGYLADNKKDAIEELIKRAVAPTEEVPSGTEAVETEQEKPKPKPKRTTKAAVPPVAPPVAPPAPPETTATAATGNEATPDFFDGLALPQGVPIRKRLAGKDVTSEETQEVLARHAGLKGVSKATKEKIENFLTLVRHFTPGNIVTSYGGVDRVKTFDWNNGNWSVDVREVKKQPAGNWVEEGRVRTHNTHPGKENRIVEKAAANVKDEAAPTADTSGLQGWGSDIAPQMSSIGAAPTAKEGDTTVSARPSANVQRLAVMLGSKLYGSPADIAAVSVKELFQNGFDAIKGAIEKGQLTKGKIDVTVDPSTRTITVTDNGSGMPTSVMGNQFLQIAGTVKETKRASGGLGVAKMLFLFENKKLEVVSLRDGVVSRMVTTGEDLKAALDDPSRGPQITVSKDPQTVKHYVDTMFPEGHGTAISIEIPKSYTDPSSGEEKPISIPDSMRAYPVLEKSPLFGDIDVTFNGTVAPMGSAFPLDNYTAFSNVKFEWGTARIYVSKENKRQYGTNSHVLSNGLWQFDTKIEVNDKLIPREFYVDVSPAENVKPEDPGYPFDLNRQNFSKQASNDFGKIFKYIGVIYSQADFAESVKNFGTVQYVNEDGTMTPSVTLEPSAPPSDTAFTLIKPTDKVEVRDGVMYVNNRTVPDLTAKDLDAASIKIDELTIPQDQLDTTKVMAHDNTQQKVSTFESYKGLTDAEAYDKFINNTRGSYGENLSNGGVKIQFYDTKTFEHLDSVEADSKEDMVEHLREVGLIPEPGAVGPSLSEIARAKFGDKRFNKYIAGIGNTFKTLRDIVAEHGTGYGDYKEGYRSAPKSLADEVIGTSIDYEYLGVSIRVPFSGMFINPVTTDSAYIGAGGDKDAPSFNIAVDFIGTMAHELAHFKQRNHGADFTKEQQRILTLFETFGGDNGKTIAQLKKDLAAHVEANRDIFDFLNKEFTDGNFEPRGNRFKDASYQQIGDAESLENMAATLPAGGQPGGGVPPGTSAGTQGAGQVGVPPGNASQTAPAGIPGTSPPVQLSAAQLARRVAIAEHKYDISKTGTEAAEAAHLLYSLRDGRQFVQFLASSKKAMSNKALSTALFLVPGDVVASWGSSWLGNENLNKTNDLIGDMRGMQHGLLKAAGMVSESMVRAIKADPSLRAKLEKAIYVSTTARIDPSIEKRDPDLNRIYAALGPEGQRVYNEVKTYYASMVDYYSYLLDEQINSANLPGGAHKLIMAEIKKLYEVDKRIVPYFPLVRNRGDFWLRIMQGKKKQFYTFGTVAERDAVMRLAASRMGISVDDMLKDKKIADAGDDLTSYRIDASDSSAMLKDTFAKIDSIKNTGSQTPAEFTKTMEDLKDSIYDLFLATMPDQSFRKSFIERKDTIGYNVDIVRNFSTSAMHMASQLSRIAYSTPLRNSLLAAQKSLEGNPDKPKYERFVQEMTRRVRLELHPFENPPTGISKDVQDIGAAVGSFATRLSFLHYLSSASSALIQLSAVPYGMANLGARHGYAETAVELAKLTRLWKEFDFRKKNADGSMSVIMPRISGLNADEERALRDMGTRGVDITLTNEMLGRGRLSSAAYQAPLQKIGRGAMTLAGGLFHNAERMSREIIYMTSYRLSRKASRAQVENGTITNDQAHKQAVDQAVADTYDSAGNMAEWNRAPVFRGVPGRVALQFLSYPMFMTMRLATTFVQMMPLLSNQHKAQAFREFAGILGVTWMLAGAVGLPTFNLILGAVGAIFNAMKDKDKPEDLKSLSFVDWFKQVWVPQILGGTKLFGKPVSDLALYGPVNFFTGIDMSSRSSLNDLWFKDLITAKNPREGAINFAVAHAGPSVNLVLSYLDAFKAYGDGDMQKFGEKILPAIARGPLAAFKYYQEGAKGVHGETLMSSDSFTVGALMAQTIGFRSSELANLQAVNFKMYTLGQEINIERTKILRNIGDAYLKEQTPRIKEWVEKVKEFNKKFPIEGVVITDEGVNRSLKRINDARAKSWKGIALTPQNIMLFMEAAAPSREAAEWLEKQSKAK